MTATLGMSRRRLFLWCGVGLGIIAIALALAVLVRLPSHANAYRRYVSPPLADGSRYTFLYPSDWTPSAASAVFPFTHTRATYLIQDVTINKPTWPGGLLLERTGFQPIPQMVSEQIRVHTSDDPAQPAPYPPGPRTLSPGPRYLRSEVVEVLNMGRHRVTITDQKSGRRYWFESDCRNDDALVNGSIRVIPPGGSSPMP